MYTQPIITHFASLYKTHRQRQRQKYSVTRSTQKRIKPLLKFLTPRPLIFAYLIKSLASSVIPYQIASSILYLILRILRNISASLSSLNGGSPDNKMYIITPADHKSTRELYYCLPLNAMTSGAT